MRNFWRLSLVAVLIALILVQNAKETHGKLKKKIMMKKLKKMLPLLLAMKPKKKLVILPLPIPMGMMSKFGSGLGFGGGGGGMHQQMPLMSAPMSAPMDNSWMMMSAMDCSSDFYGMGNPYQSMGGGSQGGWGGSSGAAISSGGDGWGGSSGGQGGYGFGGGGGGGSNQKGGRLQSGWA